MGVMRFRVYPEDRIDANVARRAYFTGPDGFLWPARVEFEEGTLSLQRSVGDSGYLHVPWPVEGMGERTLRTGWLMERQRPFHLQVELARGKINQVRNQLADWRNVGLSPPAELKNKLAEASGAFTDAATGQADPLAAARHAERAIRLAVEAAEQLGTCYSKQALAARMRYAPRLDTRLGVSLGPVAPQGPLGQALGQAFNTAAVPFAWRQIEANEREYDWSKSDAQMKWADEQDVTVYGGPLVCFDDLLLPDWLYLWEGDYDNLSSCIGDWVGAVVGRYRGRVDLWHCAARLNSAEALKLSLEQRLRIAVRAVEVLRRTDPDTPALLSFDQPWAEYMRNDDVDPPLYLADTLIRSGLGLAGVGVEMNLGYQPGGCYVRDPLDVSQLLDHWSLLGVPLYVFITAPSSAEEDPQARGPARPLPAPCADGWSPESQQRWLKALLPVVLAKSTVRGVVYNHLSDAEPHHFPHSGLYDTRGAAKPLLKSLASFRKKNLK